jgi:hypothetical protein
MKRMTLLVLLFSFSFAFAVLSEDLGELAKKEKARRESIDKSGKKAKVFTNQDVENLKSELAIASTEGENTATEDTTYTPPQEGAEYVPDPEPQPPKSDPAAEQQKRARELEQQKEELEQQAKEARDTVGAGGLYHSRNTGDQYKKAREAEEKQEKVDQQLEKSRTQQATPQSTPPAPVEEYVPPEEQPVQEEPPAEEEPPL